MGSGSGERRVEVARGVLAPALVEDALRLLHVDMLEHGHSAETLSEWLWAMHWFPHLNRREEILALAHALPGEWRSGTLCDPQILLQFPHVGPEPEIVFHLDDEPPWADGRRYVRIVGVPLSPWRQVNGGLLVQAGDGAAEPVELDPTDAVMLPPDLQHSGGVNRTGSPRYGVYFRWLENPGAPTDARYASIRPHGAPGPLQGPEGSTRPAGAGGRRGPTVAA